MAGGVRNVVIKFIGDAKGLDKASGQGQKQLGKFQQGFKKFNRFAVKASLAVGVAAVGFGKKLLAAGQDGIAAERVLANVFKKMGGASSKAFKEALPQAAKLSKAIAVPATDINRVQTKLATFGKIWEDPVKGAQNFGRATTLAFDLAAAGFGEADSNAAQLGKALQDPIKGITALAKSGVSFTNAEKKKIEQLVKSGKLLEAQELIYGALEKQVGGSAKANVTGAQKMSAAWENLQDTLGRLLIPAFDAVAAVVQKVVAWVDKNKESAIAVGVAIVGLAGFVLVANAAYKVWIAVTRTATAVKWLFTNSVVKGTARVVANTAATVASKVALVAATVATKAMRGAQLLLNAAMNANPLVRIIGLIIAVAAALVAAWNKSETFRRIVKGAFQSVGRAAAWVGRRFEDIWDAAKWVFGHVRDAVGWVIEKIKTLIGWIKDAIDWLGDLVGNGRSVQGNHIRVIGPDGKRAAGGPVSAGRTYLVGERGPEIVTMGGSGHVTPNHELGGGPSVLETHIHIGDEVVRVVRTEIKGHDRGLRRAVTMGAAG